MGVCARRSGLVVVLHAVDAGGIGVLSGSPAGEDVAPHCDRVAEAVAESGATSMKEMGVVMKSAMAKLQGKSADGKLVNEAVKAKLS